MEKEVGGNNFNSKDPNDIAKEILKWNLKWLIILQVNVLREKTINLVIIINEFKRI